MEKTASEVVAEKMKRLRVKSGRTQEQAACILHVDRSTLAKWESGKNTISLDLAKRIADVLQISLDDLVDPEKEISLDNLKYEKRIDDSASE